MELTYKFIIEYLTNNKKKNNIIKKNLIKKYDFFPNKIKNLLNNEFYVYGVLTNDNNENNISIYSSILHVLQKHFVILNDDDQYIKINNLKNYIKNNIKKNYSKFKNRKKFSKESALNIIKSNKFNPLILELLAFSFDINFFIFDFDKDNIFAINNDEYFNMWKPTILLANINNYWYPIITNKEKLFNCNNIKFLFNHDIEYYQKKYLDQHFTLLDNIFEILNNENTSNKNDLIDDDDEDDEDKNNNTFIKKVNLNKNKLTKMKKKELIEIIKEYNMNINIKNKKNELIEKILVYNI